MYTSLNDLDTLAVENFREYLRIPSVHPDVNYDQCVTFLEKQAKSIGLDFKVFQITPDKPMVILTWTGREPSLSTILLNSHMDVVPVFEDKWKYKPFGADMDENGNIYARGAQDTKCSGIQYLEAIRRLKNSNVQLRRTVHVSFAPEEEIGGVRGMADFVKMDEFIKMNVGFALDEGVGGESDILNVFYGEKKNWKFAVHCTGETGHGAALLDNTAGEKVRVIVDKFYSFREEQEKIQDETHDIVTSINLTIIQGGVQNNVIPAEFVLTFDTRVPFERSQAFETTVKQWCKEAGEGVWVEDLIKDEVIPNTDISNANLYWVAFKKALKELNLQIDVKIYSANTDARFLRSAGIPAIGFTPNRNTEFKIHENDEYLNVNVFLDSIKVYEKILPAISNV